MIKNRITMIKDRKKNDKNNPARAKLKYGKFTATAILLVAVFLLSFLIGCSNHFEKDQDKLLIITTIYPVYDFAKHVGGDKVQVIQLLPAGMESHTYEPNPKDMIMIQEADLFIYNGGFSDAWVDTILSSLKSMPETIKMIDVVDLLEEDHDEDDHDHDHEDIEYDEHVWTSLRNSIEIIQNIEQKLITLDSDNAEYYKNNSNAYTNAIHELDKEFIEFFDGLEHPLIFGDRFPFLYMSHDYGFEYYSAYPGCGHDTEPDAAKIAYLIETGKKYSLKYVYYIEFSNHVIADSVAEAIGADIALFHSAHNVSKQEIEQGAQYLSIMRENLNMLKGTTEK